MISLLCFFITSFIIRLHNANHQSFVTIYDVNKSGMIDFFDGRTVYNLQLDTIPSSQALFINQNNRFYHFVNDTIKINMKYDFHNERIRKVGNAIQFKDKIFSIIYEENQLCLDYGKSDYIVLMSNLEYEPCFNLKNNQEIIIDKSIKYNNLKEWKENLRNEKKIVEIKTSGAISIEI